MRSIIRTRFRVQGMGFGVLGFTEHAISDSGLYLGGSMDTLPKVLVFSAQPQHAKLQPLDLEIAQQIQTPTRACQTTDAKPLNSETEGITLMKLQKVRIRLLTEPKVQISSLPLLHGPPYIKRRINTPNRTPLTQAFAWRQP